MATNLATILVGLGYDLSALEKGAPEAFRMINQQTLGMSAEMKRASREGAEAWRLIDEALGIHVSRPLTRIVTQEFPGFAKAMQGLLGAGAFGALAVAGVEFLDKIAKSIEKAQKAQEELRSATENVNKIFADEISKYEKKDEAIVKATAAVDRLSDAMQKQAAAVAEANSPWTEFLATLGEGMHVLTTMPSTIGVEALAKHFEEFKKKFDELAREDALKGTQEGATALAAEIEKARKGAAAMQEMKLSWLEQAANFLSTISAHGPMTLGFSQKEIDAQQAYLQNLQKLQEVFKSIETGAHDREAQARAAEQRKEEVREMQGDLKRWNDAATEFWQTWMRINAAIEASTAKLSEIALSESLARFQRSQRLLFPDIGQIAPPAGAPMLKDQEALRKITTDQNEAWKMAGQILEQVESPLERYRTQLQILEQLKPRLGPEGFALAVQKLNEELQASEDKMARLLREGGAAGGAQAFMMQWMGETSKGSAGQFTFDFLTRSLQGFEDETVRAITTGKANWRGYFESVEQMALKFLMHKELANIFQVLSGTSLGKSLGLGGLLSGANPSQIANTTALTANTAALVANTAALATSAASSLGGSIGGVADFLPNLAFPGFASGTDFAPGGMAWVGESGPELVNLPRGSSVTPSSSARGGAPTVHVNIDARGAQMGVAEQIARSWEQNGPALVVRAVVEATEQTRRSLMNR